MRKLIIYLLLIVITDPYENIDYDEINTYYLDYECFEHCIEVLDAELENENLDYKENLNKSPKQKETNLENLGNFDKDYLNNLFIFRQL